MSCWPAWGSTSVQADSGAFSKARRAALQARSDTAVTTHVCACEMGDRELGQSWARVRIRVAGGLHQRESDGRVESGLSQDRLVLNQAR